MCEVGSTTHGFKGMGFGVSRLGFKVVSCHNGKLDECFPFCLCPLGAVPSLAKVRAVYWVSDCWPVTLPPLPLPPSLPTPHPHLLLLCLLIVAYGCKKQQETKTQKCHLKLYVFFIPYMGGVRVFMRHWHFNLLSPSTWILFFSRLTTYTFFF